MIVLDEDESTPIKSPTSPFDDAQRQQLPLPATASGQAHGPPPAYSEATTSRGTGLLGYETTAPSTEAVPYPYLLAAERRGFPKGENAKRRFLRAFGIALVIWLLFLMFVESVDITINPRKVRCTISRTCSLQAQESVTPF